MRGDFLPGSAYRTRGTATSTLHFSILNFQFAFFNSHASSHTNLPVDRAGGTLGGNLVA